MADFQTLKDWLFPAAKPLRDVAGPATPAAPASQPSGVDVAAAAQRQADRQLKPPTPAPAAPVVKKKKPSVAGTIGAQLMEP